MAGVILVTGATGTVGSATVEELVRLGVRPRAASRNPGRAKEVLPRGVEPVHFEFEDDLSMERAMEGVDAMLLVTPPLDPHELDFGIEAVDIAKASGVRHIVRLSAIGAEHAPETAHRQVELHLEESGVAFTHLRPNFFMQTLLGQLEGMREEGMLYYPAEDARTPFVDARDVGAAAARVLTSGEHVGRAYTFTGPESFTFDEVAALFGELLEREVRYQPISDDQFNDVLRSYGVSEYGTEVMAGFHRALRAGQLADPVPDLATVLGRAPTTLRELAEEAVANSEE